MIRLIAAVDKKNGIARNGQIPWDIPSDGQYFAEQTKLYGANVLTGKKTFLTYPSGFLKDRRNFVLTHEGTDIPGAELVSDLKYFLDNFNEDLWIAGGEAVYKQVFELNKADELYITKIDKDFGCDQFFPSAYEDFELVEQSAPETQNGLSFTYCKYAKKVANS